MDPQGFDATAVVQSERFRKVANGYPRTVALAYAGDLAAAAADDDTTVRDGVWRWELSQGIEPRDRQAIGLAERRGDDAESAIDDPLLDEVEQAAADEDDGT
jgi:hypothetical protein